MEAAGCRRGGRRIATVVPGPLADYAAGFREYLIAQGYARHTITGQMSMVAHLSRWLQAEGLAVEALASPAQIDRFFAGRRGQGYLFAVSGKAARVLRAFLREHEAIGEPVAETGTSAERVLAGYRTYLREERGVSASTVRCFTACAARFLQALPAQRQEEGLAGLTAGEVTRFVASWAASASPAYSKSMITALRSLLRFLHVAGHIPHALTGAVPAVPGWKPATKRTHAVTGQEVAALLASCDRLSARGRSDYAVLMLLTRLGLRAAEVAGITLEDIDWHRAVLRVRGKGNTLAELPIPVDVGEAIASYLRYGRPTTPSRHLFVSLRAPFAGLSASGIGDAVHRACAAADLEKFGPHRLRHAVACQLLREGASLAEIGQHLRQTDLRTTARYATAEVKALASLARPCPQGAAR
jgi:integrase/recombinase XerD